MNLLLAVTLLAATPFVSDEERIGPLRNPLDLVLVRSADATLLAWHEDSRVRARVNDTILDLGTGTDVRAATDGKDFQVIWVDQLRILGALASKPSDVKTLINLNSQANGFGTTYRRAPSIVWTGRSFQIFAGFDGADTAAAVNGVVFTAAATSDPAYQDCFFSLFARGFVCRNVGPVFRVDWKLRADNVAARSFAFTESGYSSIHLPFAVAGPGEFLLLWKSSAGIDGVRLRPDGSTAGFVKVPIGQSLTGKRGPQAAWDGTRYLVVFDTVDPSGNIWGAFVTPGVNLIADPFVIANGAEQESAPTVAALGPDRFGVAYKIGNDQIGTRVVSFTEPPSRRRVAR